MATRTFDDIQIRRPELARLYLQLLQAEPGRPLALFAPRRVGKTFFLDHDLAPSAEGLGMRPVYADLWLSKSAPLDAVNHAVEEALDDAQVPKSAVRRTAKTKVKKLGVMGASLELGDEPTRRALPTKADLRLDALIHRLRQASGKPVLLLLDEAQSLAEVPDGEGIAATLRAVLHKRRRDVSRCLPVLHAKAWHACCRPSAHRCTSSPRSWTSRRSATNCSKRLPSTSAPCTHASVSTSRRFVQRISGLACGRAF